MCLYFHFFNKNTKQGIFQLKYPKWYLFMALGINQVTYSSRQFCRSVGPGFATLGTSR